MPVFFCCFLLFFKKKGSTVYLNFLIVVLIKGTTAPISIRTVLALGNPNLLSIFSWFDSPPSSLHLKGDEDLDAGQKQLLIVLLRDFLPAIQGEHGCL